MNTTISKMAVQDWAPVRLPMLIDGQDIFATHWIEVFNPADPSELVGAVPRAEAVQIKDAISAAKAAQTAWGGKTFIERAAILSQALARLEDDIDSRATLLVRENGKVLAEAKAELAAVPARQKLSLSLASELDAGQSLENPSGATFVSYRPYGVVVSIVPWNAPISLGFGQLIPALLAGNGIVIKPPETCPLTLALSIRLLAQGLPSGLVNIVTGLPGEIGDALTKDPDVAKIAFTGSIPAARRIMSGAADSIKSLTLELGGNDPAIVLPDADLSEMTMERMARAVFRMSGQICMAIKRIYLPESLESRFIEGFSSVVNRMSVGNGLFDGITMGPMHTQSALDRALKLIADAEAADATVEQLGTIHSSARGRRGYFMQPTIVTGIADDSALMVEEQFCPAIPITTYRDVDDAMERANNSVFALGASVWGSNVKKAADIARRFEAGTVFVNAHGTEAINRRAPYGGMKQSGIGRKSGLQGILEYTEVQTLTTFTG